MGSYYSHKGIIELINAFSIIHAQIPEFSSSSNKCPIPGNDSIELIQQCRSVIQSLDLKPYVTLITEYLEDELSFSLLSLADVIVYPYQYTQESSSAAVRHGSGNRKTSFLLPLSIF